MTRPILHRAAVHGAKTGAVLCLASLVGASAIAQTETSAASAAASSPTLSGAESHGDAPTLGGAWLAVVLALAIVLAAASFLLRRRLAGRVRIGGAARSVRIVESTRLGQHLLLSVISYKGRELLVAHGSQTATVLADRAADEPAQK